MPKLEPKMIQRDLERGLVWPLYWVYGPEKMKSRELVKRIRKTVLGEQAGESGRSGLSLSEEWLEGTEVDASQVLDSAQSPSLLGGVRLIIVRDAHALKNAELLAELLGPAVPLPELTSVCVLLSKDLDARKKFSKLLVEMTAVVPCEEVSEGEREAWIGYLAKRRALEVGPDDVLKLSTLDPWSLDIVDQELEKLSLGGTVFAGSDSGRLGGADEFMEAFFGRDLPTALAIAGSFADKPDEALPCLGLFAWNVRHLALLIGSGGRAALNPYVAEKLKRWASNWKLTEVLALQEELAALDFNTKQTPLLPLGLWTDLVTRQLRSSAAGLS